MGRHTGTARGAAPHRAVGSRRYAALVAAATLLALGACSRAVEVALPDAAGGPACQGLADRWPASVSGLSARPVSVDSAAARAWGDPAVVAICGYPAPGPSTLECLSVDGIDWLVQRRSNGVQFTTYGRSPALDVLVPSAYAPEPLLLPAFGDAARSLPQTGRHCT